MSNENVSMEYRGFVIRFNKFSETWEVLNESEEMYSNKEYGLCIKFVDKYKKKDVKEIAILIERGGDKNYRDGFITSIDSEGAIWIKYKNQSGDDYNREKISTYSSGTLILKNKENEDTIAKIIDCKKRIEAIDKEVSKLEKVLIYFKPKI
jgi:hypothetical protein